MSNPEQAPPSNLPSTLKPRIVHSTLLCNKYWGKQPVSLPTVALGNLSQSYNQSEKWNVTMPFVCIRIYPGNRGHLRIHTRDFKFGKMLHRQWRNGGSNRGQWGNPENNYRVKPLRPLTGGTEGEVVLLAPGQKQRAWQDCAWRDGAAAGVAAQDRREGWKLLASPSSHPPISHRAFH